MSGELNNSLPKTAAAIQSGINENLHYGAQICVWHAGREVVNAGLGTVDGSESITSETVNLWLSSGKPVGAVAMMLLQQETIFSIDEPVASYWPEFGANGKEAITTRHILTHTGGFRNADVAANAAHLEEALSVIAEARIERDWIPGERAGYHASGGWQVLGQLVNLLSGMPYDEFVSNRIFQPLGMERSTFAPLSGSSLRLSPMYTARDGEFRVSSAYTPEFLSSFPRPGGGLYSTASDVVRFYRMLMEGGELDGRRVLSASDVAEIVSRHRTGMKDETFGYVMDWGLGVMFDNKAHAPKAPYGYGAHASADTFGHGGRESSTGFADPEHELVVALVFNGMPGEPTHDRRLRSVTTAIYEDLGLDG